MKQIRGAKVFFWARRYDSRRRHHYEAAGKKMAVLTGLISEGKISRQRLDAR